MSDNKVFIRANIKLFILDFLFLSVLMTVSFPFSKFVFYPAIFISLLYTLYYIRFNLKIIFRSFKSLWLIMIQLCLFAIAFARTSSLNPSLIKEGINFLSIVIIGFVLFCLIENIRELNRLYKNLIRVAIYSILIIYVSDYLSSSLNLRALCYQFITTMCTHPDHPYYLTTIFFH